MLLLRRLGPGGPRGVAVAMFGHTGLGTLICRIAALADWLLMRRIAYQFETQSFLLRPSLLHHIIVADVQKAGSPIWSD